MPIWSVVRPYLVIAIRWNVIRRAIVLAIVVGCVLVGINHGNCIVHGKFGALCLVQSLLTVFVPYCVSTVSSVLAIRDREG